MAGDSGSNVGSEPPSTAMPLKSRHQQGHCVSRQTVLVGQILWCLILANLKLQFWTWWTLCSARSRPFTGRCPRILHSCRKRSLRTSCRASRLLSSPDTIRQPFLSVGKQKLVALVQSTHSYEDHGADIHALAAASREPQL